MDNGEKFPNLNTPNAIKNRFSGDRAVINGKKGNQKRTENLRISKLLQSLLLTNASSELAKNIIKESGVELKGKKVKNKEVLAMAIMQQALAGNFKMTQLLLKIIGEMPTDITMFNVEAQKQDLEYLVDAIKGVEYGEEQKDTKKD